MTDTERLGADGRLLEAIAVLTAANRRERDPEIEERLVRLRLDALGELERADGPAAWPPPVEDLFPGVVGPPEVTGTELTAETLRSGIFHHGCLLVRGLLDRPRSRALVAEIDRVLAAQEAHRRGAPVSETTPHFVPFPEFPEAEREWAREAGGVIVVDSPRALFDLVETFEEAGIGELLTGFLGERPALLGKKWTLRRVRPDLGVADWHQDGSFMGTDIRTVNLWLALSECGDDAPSMDVVARRLDGLVERGTHGAMLDWAVGPGMAEIVAEGTIVRPRFAPGDALLFDHLFLHRTDTHPGMTRDRYAIEAWFAAPSSYPPTQLPVAY